MGRTRAMSRMPQVGDMLVVTCTGNHGPDITCICRTTGEKHIGSVIEIKHDKWGHQQNVLIEWSTDSPAHYRMEHGYSGTNIHNIRDRFTLVRSGINIP